MDDSQHTLSISRKAATAVSLDRVVHLFCATGTADGILPPTALYNEGWMMRLVLDWFDRNRESAHPLQFAPKAAWRSEALLASQFRARYRGDRLAESWTHADGVIGHVRPSSGRGDTQLEPEATQFVVVEAKMGSGLSAGTTRADRFDQAARNVACIVEAVRLSGCSPHAFTRLGWVLLAPESQIQEGVFGELCSRSSIEQSIRNRVGGYEGQKDAWLRDVCIPILDHIEVTVLSWEAVLGHIAGADPLSASGLTAFYEECCRFNLRTLRSRA